MSGDGLTRTPFAIVPRWVIQRATSNGLKVYAYLSDRANPDKGNTCWPSIETIANDTRLSESTVKRHIKELIELGALRREARQDGYIKTSNLYTVEFSEPKPEVTGDPCAEVTGEPCAEVTGDPLIRTIEQEPVEQDTPLPPSLPLSASSVLVTPDENPAPGRSPGPDSTEGFERWWEMYPKKKEKKACLAYWRRMSAADREAALAAIPKHLAFWEMEGTDPQYIKYPGTWLRRGCWDDDLTPSAPAKRKGLLDQMDDAFAEQKEQLKEQLTGLRERDALNSPVLELPTETGDTP